MLQNIKNCGLDCILKSQFMFDYYIGFRKIMDYQMYNFDRKYGFKNVIIAIGAELEERFKRRKR